MNSLTTMLQQARHWRVRYRSRQLIYDEGEASTAIFRVEAGCVRLQVNGEDGNRQIVAFLFPGDTFGVCVAERTSAAEAVTNVELTRYALQSVLQCSAQSRELTVELLHAANTLFNDFAHHVEHIGRMSASDRVLWFLTWLSHRQGHRRGETVQMPMTLRDVGDFLALSPETLSRVLRELQSEGLVALRGRRAYAIRQPTIELGAPFGDPTGPGPQGLRDAG